MYKHYRTSGSGVRPLADVWLYLGANAPSMDWAETRLTLSGMGLTAFEQSVSRLADAWFNGREPGPELSDLADFLLGGGLFGATGTREINRALADNPGGGVRALLSALLLAAFPGRASMARAYPALHGRPYLLPFYWIARWVRALAFRRERLSVFPALFSARARALLRKDRPDRFE